MRPIPKERSVLLLVVALLAAGCLVSACMRSETIPTEARGAVEKRAAAVYTDAYSGVSDFDQVSQVLFSRAWRAENLPEGMSAAREVQVWCVELSVTGTRQGEAVSERPIWIAIQDESGVEWSVQPLVLFSAIWPYESCSVAP